MEQACVLCVWLDWLCGTVPVASVEMCFVWMCMWIMLIVDASTGVKSSFGGLVGYDDWFTPSRSGVRSSPEVFWTNLAFCDQALIITQTIHLKLTVFSNLSQINWKSTATTLYIFWLPHFGGSCRYLHFLLVLVHNTWYLVMVASKEASVIGDIMMRTFYLLCIIRQG